MGEAKLSHRRDRIGRKNRKEDRCNRKIKKKELRNLFIIDNEHIDLLLELDANKRDIQEELILKEIKLEKLKISQKTIKSIRLQIIGH